MKTKFLFPLLALALTAVSCKDDDDDKKDDEPTTATVNMHYNYTFGADDFVTDQYYNLGTGEKVKFSLATFYLGDPAFRDDNDNVRILEPAYTIVRPETQMTSFGEVEPGAAGTFFYKLGIDSITNVTVQPSDFNDPNEPLAPQPEGMWWSWASGYIFVKLEGEVDVDADGTADTTFKYHLGTNPLLVSKNTALPGDFTAGENYDLEMTIDLEKVFTNLDMQNDFLTMTLSNLPLATKVMNNFGTAVTVKKME